MLPPHAEEAAGADAEEADLILLGVDQEVVDLPQVLTLRVNGPPSPDVRSRIGDGEIGLAEPHQPPGGFGSGRVISSSL